MKEQLLAFSIGFIAIGITIVLTHDKPQQHSQKVKNSTSVYKSFCPERISDKMYYIITMRYGDRVRHKKCWTDPCTGKAMSEFID